MLVYVIVLGLGALHDVELAVAALIISARPSLGGLHSFLPLPALLFFVFSNLLLVAHNVVCNGLSAVFLVCWHFPGMKSTLGTMVDALPAVVGAWYVTASTRVRHTFVRG